MKKIFLAIFSLCVSVKFGLSQSNDVSLQSIDDYNGWGKKALIIENGFIQLILMPEIGARVVHYGFEDDEYMAINESVMPNTYNPASNVTGPWSSWGYGGYKVWPAPQSFWNWPPPPYLDWGNYEYSIEHQTADSVVIYARSTIEANKTPGLQQARRYKIYKNTTKVIVEQILINVSSNATNWSIWEVTQAIKDHDGTGDYQNISTYFPSDESSIKVLSGAKLTTTAVTENVRKFNANGNNQKIGSLIKEGWACFVDEKDEQTYAKVFDIFPETEQYPDQNTNFQIYVGGAYIEIEVLGPLTEVAKGDSTSYCETWYAAKIKGSILKTNNSGAVRTQLSINSSLDMVTGEFGVFSSGSVKLHYYDAGTSEIGTSNSLNVEAAQKLTLNESVVLPTGTKKIKLLTYDLTDKLIGVLDSCSTEVVNSIKESIAGNNLEIFPNQVRSGEAILINAPEINSNRMEISLISLSGKTVYKNTYLTNTEKQIEFLLPNLSEGVYIVRLSTNEFILQNKLIIY